MEQFIAAPGRSGALLLLPPPPSEKIHGVLSWPKVRGAYKYRLTAIGKQVVALGVKIKEFFIAPSLALCNKPLSYPCKSDQSGLRSYALTGTSPGKSGPFGQYVQDVCFQRE
jgi:hypothetical protein